MADDLPDAPWVSGGAQANQGGSDLPDAPWMPPKMSVGEAAAAPVTSLWPTFKQMESESAAQVGRGFGQIGSLQPGEMLKGVGNVALGTLGEATAPINAPLRTFVGDPVERAATKAVGPQVAPYVSGAAEFGAGLFVPGHVPRMPRMPQLEPYGITRTLGETRGDLNMRANEAAAMRPGSDDPYGQAFAAQRADQRTAAEEQLQRNLDPQGQIIAQTPTEAGALASSAIRSEAASAKATSRSLYDRAKAMPGEIHASVFDDMPTGIKQDIGLGDNPVIIGENTPNAAKMINYLDQQIGNLKITNRADPYGPPRPTTQTQTILKGPGYHIADDITVPPNITGVNLQGVDQWRKVLSGMRQDAFASSMPGQVSADARAAQKVLDAFDDRIDAAVNSNLFTGDPRAVDAWNQARQAYSDWKNTFTAGRRNDAVGKVMQKITGDLVNDPLTPTKVLDEIVSPGGVKPTSTQIAVANRIRNVLGENSPEWTGIKQGLLQRVLQAGEGETEFGTAKQAQRLSQFLNGDMAGRMYSPGEQAMLRGYANLMRDITPPPGSYNPSGGAIRQLASSVSQRMGGIVGAVIGHAISPFPIMGELAGYTLGKQAERLSEQHLFTMSKNFPIVSQQMRAWSQAQARAANAPTNPFARRAAVMAGAKLQQALQPFGIDLKALAGSPGPAEAQPQQNNIPGSGQQQNRGGAVQRQPRARGGEANHPMDSKPLKGARKARDGHWYVGDKSRPGRYLLVVPR